MPMKLAPLLILLAGLAIAGYGTWYHRSHPSRIVATGSVTMADPRTGQPVTFDTRTREVGSIRLEEVRSPGGAWIDCSGDCRETLRREHLEFWEHQQLRR